MKNYKIVITCKYDDETGIVHDAVVDHVDGGTKLFLPKGKTLNGLANSVKEFIVSIPVREENDKKRSEL